MLRRVDVRARARERERVRVSFLLVITCNAVKRGHYKLSRGPASRVGRSTASPTAWPGVLEVRVRSLDPSLLEGELLVRVVGVGGVSHRLQSSSRVRGPEYAGATKHSRRRVEGRAHQPSISATARGVEVHAPLSIIVSHEAQDRTVKLTVAGKTAVVGRRGLSRYLALSTVSVLRHVHRCTSTHPVTAHRSPAPPPPAPGAPPRAPLRSRKSGSSVPTLMPSRSGECGL